MKTETFNVDKEMAYLKEDRREVHYLKTRIWKKNWSRVLTQVRNKKTKRL